MKKNVFFKLVETVFGDNGEQFSKIVYVGSKKDALEMREVFERANAFGMQANKDRFRDYEVVRA